MNMNKTRLIAAHRRVFGKLGRLLPFTATDAQIDAACAVGNHQNPVARAEQGWYFGQCLDCRATGPMRKTERGAVQALLKGLTK